MAVSVLSAPAAYPVSISSCKQHLRIDHDQDDDYLSELIAAATSHVEAHIRQSLINRTLRQYVDGSAAGRSITLDAWPVGSLITGTAYNIDGEALELSPGDMLLDRNSDPATVSLKPSIGLLSISNGIEIDYVAGYGDTGLDVPSNIIRALHLIVAHWYEHRGAGIAEIQQSMPPGVDRLLAPTRKVKL